MTVWQNSIPGPCYECLNTTAKKTKKEKNIKEEIDVKKAKDVKIEPSYSAGKTFKAKGGKEYHEKSGE